MKRRVGVLEAVRLATGTATLADLWDRLAKVYGRRIMVSVEQPLRLHVLHATELSHEDVADVVARLAGGLDALGVRAGDRVAVCTENRIDYALTVFAAIRAGALAVPLHHHLTAPEVASLTARAKAKFLIADPAVAVKVRGVKTFTAGPGGDLDRACAGAPPLSATKIGPDDPVMILFTSGTTGAPKGATLTSRSLLAVARLAALVPEASKESGVCGLPLAHVMGMSTFLLNALSGAQVHWLTKFDAKKVLARIVETRATFFVGVPAMYAMLAEAGPEGYDLSSIRLFASGADAMPPALVERFRKLGCAFASPLGQRLMTAAFAEIYGMVELSGPAILKFTPPVPVAGARVTAAAKRVAARAAAFASQLGVKGSPSEVGEGLGNFGIPIPPYRVRVLDEHGVAVKAGVVGELAIRGPGVTKGYDGDATATKKATRDGWLMTGDLAKRSRLGLIAFVTRKKDVIKHGGFSVFPAEVEAQMTEHPAIAEAVVFGVPHATKGAVPVAVVVLAKGANATERDLLAWCRENIAPFKAPRALVVRKSADIPRNANKKVMKDALKEATLPALAKQIADVERRRSDARA